MPRYENGLFPKCASRSLKIFNSFLRFSLCGIQGNNVNICCSSPSLLMGVLSFLIYLKMYLLLVKWQKRHCSPLPAPDPSSRGLLTQPYPLTPAQTSLQSARDTSSVPSTLALSDRLRLPFNTSQVCDGSFTAPTATSHVDLSFYTAVALPKCTELVFPEDFFFCCNITAY